MDAIVTSNRTILKSIPQWIRYEDWKSPPSLFNYGVPPYIFPKLNLPISNEPNLTDLICYYALSLIQLEQDVSYLEIGVSVGKSFWQIHETCINFAKTQNRKCQLHGLDIEKPNLVLANLLSTTYTANQCIEAMDHDFLERNANSLRKDLPNRKWSWGSDDVVYFEGDEFDRELWLNIKKDKRQSTYNLIFSDACHLPSALLFEYEQITKLGLLDITKPFAYIFDDLENDSSKGHMWSSVKHIAKDLMKLSNDSQQKIQFKHLTLPGWIGEHEHLHNVAVITNVHGDV